MQDYLVGSADKYGLRERIQFNIIVVSLRWIESDRQREILMRAKYGREETRRYNVVINAHGPTNRWEWPKIDGLEDFQGVKMHTGDCGTPRSI